MLEPGKKPARIIYCKSVLSDIKRVGPIGVHCPLGIHERTERDNPPSFRPCIFDEPFHQRLPGAGATHDIWYTCMIRNPRLRRQDRIGHFRLCAVTGQDISAF